MPEKEFNEVFSNRLRYYLAKYDITQVELAKKLGVGSTSVYNWCNGIKTPRMDKVDAMCDLFHCKRSDLMEETIQAYNLDPDAKDLAQFLYENPDYKVLFDASRKVKTKDINFVKEVLDRMNSQ